MMNISSTTSFSNYALPRQAGTSAQAEGEQNKALEAKQDKEQQALDEKKIQELKDRDREVRLHEQAHAAVGGQYAGAPTYDFETGPDGRQYAVGGEVSIDVSEANDPKDTVDKMQVVRAAALAPAEPSPQDFKVAAEAQQKEQAARAEVAKQAIEKNNTGGEAPAKQSSSPAATKAIGAYQVFSQADAGGNRGDSYQAFA